MFGIPMWGIIAVVVAGALAYNFFIENPRVAFEARQGYVAEATQAALKAELDEATRQRLAAEAVQAKWLDDLKRTKMEQAANEADDEARIKKYEAALSDATRTCRQLDARDMQLLQYKRK